MTFLLTGLLRAYRLIVSPLYGQTCRYYPSCSAYALTSIERHGSLRGSWLALRRLGRCHPWCAGGVDLVPARENYRWWGQCDGTEAEAPVPSSPPAESSRPCPSVPPSGPDQLTVARGV